MKTKIILGLAVLLVVIQFFRIDKDVPTYAPEDDFLEVSGANQQISNLVKSSCYDCHSFETQYPWYSNVAPVSWWVKDHVNHARKHLNFSIWATYTEKRKNHKLKETIEELEEEEMPLGSYTWMHSEARLTNEQRKQLIDWVRSIR